MLRGSHRNSTTASIFPQDSFLLERVALSLFGPQDARKSNSFRRRNSSLSLCLPSAHTLVAIYLIGCGYEQGPISYYSCCRLLDAFLGLPTHDCDVIKKSFRKL